MKQRLRLISAGLGILGLGALAGLYYFAKRGESEIAGTISVPGLERPVRIIRDVHGIPHIYAENRKDLAFGLGYAEAQDRLWQLDVNRHAVNGSLAQIFGKAALENDLFSRTVGLEDAARRALEGLSPEARAEMESFAAGVNACVGRRAGRMPIEFTLADHEFEPLEAIDCTRTGILVAWGLSLNFNDEVLSTRIAAKLGRDSLPELFPDPPETILPAEAGLDELSNGEPRRVAAPQNSEPFEGISSEVLARLARELALLPSAAGNGAGGIAASNNWVVRGEASSTGMPLLANDPHLPLAMPSLWYEAHLVTPDLDVIGAAVPGLPYITIGHNLRIAFGFTNVMTDNQDLYIEKVNPENPRQVWYIDHWEEVKSEKVVIQVKGEGAVDREILRTRHGPIITSVRPGLTETLALSWVGHRPTQSLEGFRLLNAASNWQEARAAVRLFSETSLNLIYADMDGNIGWQVTGAVPIRKSGNGHFPSPGWTGEHEWTGMVPFDLLPSFYLPAGSNEPVAVGSAEERINWRALVTANQKSVRGEYPHHISNTWAAPYRFLRISSLLSQKPILGREDMRAIQADRYPLLLDTFRRALKNLDPDTDDLRSVVQTLLSWDGQLSAGSSAAVLYELAWLHIVRNTYADEMGELYDDYASKFGAFYTGMDELIERPRGRWWDDVRTNEVETRASILPASLLDALQDARRRLGTNPSLWEWGALHPAVFAHFLGRRWPLDRLLNRAVPYGGDGNTVNNGAYALNRPFQITWASSYRMIVDLGDIGHAEAMNTTGQSGVPFSRHYGDMISAWSRVEYHPLWIDESEILAHSEGTLTLQPQFR